MHYHSPSMHCRRSFSFAESERGLEQSRIGTGTRASTDAGMVHVEQPPICCGVQAYKAGLLLGVSQVQGSAAGLTGSLAAQLDREQPAAGPSWSGP